MLLRCLKHCLRVVYFLDLAQPRQAKNPPILGVQACLWTEPVASEADAEILLFPRLFAVAEVRSGPRFRGSWCEVLRSVAQESIGPTRAHLQRDLKQSEATSDS